MNTDIKISKPFWAIVECTDFNGYHTGKPYQVVTLIEFDTATELDEAIGAGSVEAGESMGAYVFEVLAMYQDWNVHQQNVGYEQEARESEPIPTCPECKSHNCNFKSEEHHASNGDGYGSIEYWIECKDCGHYSIDDTEFYEGGNNG